MFIIQYTLKDDDYENWYTEQYQGFDQAIARYTEYADTDMYDQVRLTLVVDSVHK